tara:strand:+ start:320 stop:613 length:294 start_codon:yes stop_codon:yes gene_type:complete
MNYSNHLSLGVRDVDFKGKRVASSLNSEDFEVALQMLRGLTRSVGVIPPGFEHRADLIANLFYGSPDLDWVVLWVNNIADPFQQLNIGDRIIIVDMI